MRALSIALVALTLCAPAAAEKTVDAAAGTFGFKFVVPLDELIAGCVGTGTYRGPWVTRDVIARAAGVCVPVDSDAVCLTKTEAYCAAYRPECPISPSVAVCAAAGVTDGLCTAEQGEGEQKDKDRCARLAAAKGVGGCSVDGTADQLANCDAESVRFAYCPSATLEEVPEPATCHDHLELWLRMNGLTRLIDRGLDMSADVGRNGQGSVRRAGVID